MLVNARELSPTEQGNLLRRFTIFMEFCIRRWLKQYAGDWFRAMYATMLNFRAWRGMRHGELLGLHWQDSNFDNGTLQVRRSVSRVRKQFQKLLVDAGLPHMRFHDLRHSAATIFMSWGVPAKVVQEILGHANISMTLGIYSHVLPGMQDDAMGKWYDLLGRDE